MATIVTSVEVVPGRLPNAAALDAALAAIRGRFPRAVVDRYLELLPRIADGVLIAPGAAVVGDVSLGSDVSVWYGCVLRGDVARVEVGDRSNIQDGTVLHVADGQPCIVGSEVVVGHRAMLHACRIEDGCLIGMQATVLDGAEIGHGSIVGAGAVVTPGTIVPGRSLVLGCPAKVVRPVQAHDEEAHRALARKYVRLKENYLRDAWAQPDRRTP